ncbi:MAG: hypothetical protein J6X44_03330, partial [Thermoguttaceae bacterium]|nr:hypothetical protein [Thermoguttaceae bacterium]
NVTFGTNAEIILNDLHTTHMASPMPPATNGAWDAFNPFNADIVTVQTKEATLKYDSAVAAAYQTYVEKYTTEFRKETVSELAIARSKYSDELAEETTLNNAELNARGVAYSSYVTAIQNADCTSNLLTYANSTLNSSSTYDSATSTAYGDFQIGNRQNRLNGVTSSNGRYNVYNADVSWAQQTKSLRNQYYEANNGSISDYYDALTSYYATYNTAALTAQASYATGSSNVAKTFEQNVETSRTTYALAQFDAAKDRLLAELDASIAQLTANAAKEAELTLARYSSYHGSVETPLTTALSAIAAVDFETSGCVNTLSSAKSTFASAASNAASADSTLAQTNETALTNEKTQNAATYATAITAAETAYNNAVRNAWNDSYLTTLQSGATAKLSDADLAAIADAALASAYADYRSNVFANYAATLDDLDMIDQIASYQQGRVNLGSTIPSDAFADLDDPDFDYQVCFAAGTPVLMADGTRKPIETIRPGDMVLASDHLDPESKPVPARVARFFDNGLKEVVRVRFEGGTELVCTPGHRFYVVGQGWKHACDLVLGNYCLNSDGERVAFEGREEITESV